MGKLKAFQVTGRHYCWLGSLFPAYMGISPSAPTVSRFPCICGVEPFTKDNDYFHTLFSPRMWDCHPIPPWKQVILSSILREIFSRQQARAKEPTLPEQLRTPKRTEDPCIGGLRFGMKGMPDGTFAVYPTGVQESPTDGTTVLYLTMPEGYSAATFEARRVTAPPTPMEMVCRPSRYGRTKTGDDVLEANRQAFKNAQKNATTEAMWLDQLGVDFTRWEFALTPDGEHIASATIYLQDSNDVSELMYEATQKCIPGASGYYRRWCIRSQWEHVHPAFTHTTYRALKMQWLVSARWWCVPI